MGTRGVIARRTGEHTFTGRYHHWDSYPDGLGVTLVELYQGHFKRDLPSMLKVLLDEHPAGWSTINEADFAKPAGYEEGGFKTAGPKCYCHGGRAETANEVTEKDASSIGCEYAYVFTDGARMLVLGSYNGTGKKMIGMFGSGNAKAKWKLLADIDLNAPDATARLTKIAA